MANQAIGAVVVIVRGVWCDGDNSFQPLDPGGGRGEWQRAVKGGTRHANFTGAPVRFDLFVTIYRCETFRPSAEPVYDGFGCQ